MRRQRHTFLLSKYSYSSGIADFTSNAQNSCFDTSSKGLAFVAFEDVPDSLDVLIIAANVRLPVYVVLVHARLAVDNNPVLLESIAQSIQHGLAYIDGNCNGMKPTRPLQ